MSFMLVGMLLLTGCASNMVWVKDGATQEQFAADQFDCKQKAYTMVGGYHSNNIGALAVSAPGFFNECMQSKGYTLTTQQQQANVSVDGWLTGHVPHQGKVWARIDMFSDDQAVVNQNFTAALDAYRECNGHREDQEARVCMEEKGYRLFQVATMQPSNMTKQGFQVKQGWRDKMACDAPTLDEVKACLRGKGYVPIAMAHGTRVQYAAQ